MFGEISDEDGEKEIIGCGGGGCGGSVLCHNCCCACC